MNEVLFFLSVALTFLSVIVSERLFGKVGLFAWVAFAPVMANILTAKQITLFGLDVTMGTILFASVFLAMDILNEKHGRREANKAAWLAFWAVCGYIIVTSISLLYTPNEFDFASESMGQLFGVSLRISIVSALLFLAANLADIAIYNLIGRKQKALWLRNNVSTILSNGAENFLFVTLAFYGQMTFTELMLLALGTTIIEIIASICGTPFLYYSARNKK